MNSSNKYIYKKKTKLNTKSQQHLISFTVVCHLLYNFLNFIFVSNMNANNTTGFLQNNPWPEFLNQLKWNEKQNRLEAWGDEKGNVAKAG